LGYKHEEKSRGIDVARREWNAFPGGNSGESWKEPVVKGVESVRRAGDQRNEGPRDDPDMDGGMNPSCRENS